MHRQLLFFFLAIIALVCVYLYLRRRYPTKTSNFALAPHSAQLPLKLYQDLYWFSLSLTPTTSTNYNTFTFVCDTGSSLITLPGASCVKCTGSHWPNTLDTPLHIDGYEGGQVIHYQLSNGYSPTLGRNLQIAVMGAGSDNPQGPTVNLFGMLNQTLNLDYLRIDFPQLRIVWGPDALTNLPNITYSSLYRIPYWAIPVPLNAHVQYLILDSGSNYVLIDSSYGITSDFSFSVGQTVIRVPASLIRIRPALVPGTIIIGNLVLRHYSWLFDLVNLRVAAF